MLKANNRNTRLAHYNFSRRRVTYRRKPQKGAKSVNQALGVNKSTWAALNPAVKWIIASNKLVATARVLRTKFRLATLTGAPGLLAIAGRYDRIRELSEDAEAIAELVA